ncbi:hypothetical protein ACFYZE_24320 [Streptomyces sp. NPDC001796]|uniref:hypothetical protein n=1 Tax=Streptomyces sp. NPDC001796 TaxID=3364609 RepID=UPI0036AE4491
MDAGTAGLREADHLIHHLVDVLGLPSGTAACTHLIRGTDRRSTVVSLALPDAATADAAWKRLVALLAGPDRATAGAVLGEREHGPAGAVACAAQAAAEHERRQGGRAVVFPGVERLTSTVTVGEVLTHTAIDRIVVLGAPPDAAGPDGDAQVVTRDHVRPEWHDGQLVLTLQPAAGGMLAPFEVPNPTPCCADHS